MPEDKTRLNDEQIDRQVARLDGWERDGKWLQKDYVFDNFKQINQFLPHLGQTIASHNHHPDFSFDSGSKTVHVQMTTHTAGQITQSDLDLAKALENWHD